MTDTMLCLNANSGKAYHLIFGKIVSLKTITSANESRCFQIYEDLEMSLIKEAKQLNINEDNLDVWLKGIVLAIDATTIYCTSLLFLGYF